MASPGATVHARLGNDNKWWISSGNSSTIWTDPMGTAHDYRLGPTEYILPYGPVHQALTLNTALDYWFFNTSPLKRLLSRNMHVKFYHNKTNNEGLGFFHYSALNNNVYIEIWKHNEVFNNSELIDTILHELGHAKHYTERGNWNYYWNVEKLVRESWASFTGWYLTAEYYKKYFNMAFSGKYGSHRQLWTYNSSNVEYSPLFIDLLDDYNQCSEIDPVTLLWTFYHNRPNDRISDVPVNIIEWIAYNSNERSEFRENLRHYVDVLFTYQEFSDFLLPYNSAEWD